MQLEIGLSNTDDNSCMGHFPDGSKGGFLFLNGILLTVEHQGIESPI